MPRLARKLYWATLRPARQHHSFFDRACSPCHLPPSTTSFQSQCSRIARLRPQSPHLPSRQLMPDVYQIIDLVPSNRVSSALHGQSSCWRQSPHRLQSPAAPPAEIVRISALRIAHISKRRSPAPPGMHGHPFASVVPHKSSPADKSDSTLQSSLHAHHAPRADRVPSPISASAAITACSPTITPSARRGKNAPPQWHAPPIHPREILSNRRNRHARANVSLGDGKISSGFPDAPAAILPQSPHPHPIAAPAQDIFHPPQYRSPAVADAMLARPSINNLRPSSRASTSSAICRNLRFIAPLYRTAQTIRKSLTEVSNRWAKHDSCQACLVSGYAFRHTVKRRDQCAFRRCTTSWRKTRPESQSKRR